jgi:hypothetical protein
LFPQQSTAPVRCALTTIRLRTRRAPFRAR